MELDTNDIKQLLGMQIATPFSDKLTHLWNKLMDGDNRGIKIMLDPHSMMSIRKEDFELRNIVVSYDTHGGMTWRNIPLQVVMPALPVPNYAEYKDPNETIAYDCHEVRLMAIEYVDRATGRTKYLDSSDNSEGVS